MSWDIELSTMDEKILSSQSQVLSATKKKPQICHLNEGLITKLMFLLLLPCLHFLLYVGIFHQKGRFNLHTLLYFCFLNYTSCNSSPLYPLPICLVSKNSTYIYQKMKNTPSISKAVWCINKICLVLIYYHPFDNFVQNFTFVASLFYRCCITTSRIPPRSL